MLIVLGRDRVQTATSYAYHARGRGAGGGSEGGLTDVDTDYIMGPCPPRAVGVSSQPGHGYDTAYQIGLAFSCELAY